MRAGSESFVGRQVAAVLAALALLLPATPAGAVDPAASHSVARRWNEALLEAIRHDYARPTVHARNLYHVSVAMWDAWAAYDRRARGVLYHEKMRRTRVAAQRDEAISYAAYRVLESRFAASPGSAETLPALSALMAELGYDAGNTATAGDTPAALGNRIAAAVIAHGLADGSNQVGDYANRHYQPANRPLLPVIAGNPNINDPNRWQPLALAIYIDQAGRALPSGEPQFLSPEWGDVTPFALTPADRVVHVRDGRDWPVYHDPGPPPYLGGAGDADYKAGYAQVLLWSGRLDPADGVMVDIGPGARGNNTPGTNDGRGHALNPASGKPYAPQLVPAGDYYRVLAEFWADGPDSETPPGHWFAILNRVADHPLHQRRLGGSGRRLDVLEWDVKTYLALGGAMHDVAIAAWGIKGWYDTVRPISAIRFMCEKGQSTDPAGPSWNPSGIPLHPGTIEVITRETAAPGGRHAHLAGTAGEHIGKIAVRAWRGPDRITNPATDTAGVGWIRCENWWPYQRPTFVTPPFGGYVSGHSAYSRAGAEMLARLTGDAFFPGGMAEFHAPRGEYLKVEDGPGVDVTLQWATYFDAADECSLSRIYGGIHPPQDDIPGRLIGAAIAEEAFARALRHFDGTLEDRDTRPAHQDVATAR